MAVMNEVAIRLHLDSIGNCPIPCEQLPLLETAIASHSFHRTSSPPPNGDLPTPTNTSRYCNGNGNQQLQLPRNQLSSTNRFQSLS